MKVVQPIVVVVGAVMYVVIFVFIDHLNDADTVQWAFVIAGAWNVLLLTATIISIVDSFRRLRAGDTRELATSALVVKLASIPFFVLNYLMLAFLFIGGGVILLFGGFVLWIAVAIGSGLTYLAILSTSIYTWAAIAQLRRDKVIGTPLTVLYVILSLVYVTDIAAVIMVFGHDRRRPRLALVVMLLAFGLLVLTAGILIFSVDPILVDLFIPALGTGVVVAVVGLTVIVTTGVITFVQRTSMRHVAQRATLAPAVEST